MFPLINKQETGVNLRRIMDMRGITPKDVQEYLGLGCVQSVWKQGIDCTKHTIREIECTRKKITCILRKINCTTCDIKIELQVQ